MGRRGCVWRVGSQPRPQRQPGPPLRVSALHSPGLHVRGGGAWRRPAKEAGWRSSSVPLLSLGKPSVCISRQDLEEQLAADASPPQRPELPEGRLAQKSPVPPWPGPQPDCLGLCFSGVGGTGGNPGVLAESPVLGAPAGPSQTRAPAVRH